MDLFFPFSFSDIQGCKKRDGLANTVWYGCSNIQVNNQEAHQEENFGCLWVEKLLESS